MGLGISPPLALDPQDAVHRLHELACRDRLLQKGNATVAGHPHLIGVARHEDHGQGGPALSQLLRQVAAAHPGHDHIGQQDVDGIGVRLVQGDRGIGPIRGLHDESRLGQHLLQDLSDALLVFDQQDRAGALIACRCGDRSITRRSRHEREEGTERGPFSRLAVHFEETPL